MCCTYFHTCTRIYVSCTVHIIYNISRPARAWCSPGLDAMVHVFIFFLLFRIQVMVCHVPLIIIRFGQHTNGKHNDRNTTQCKIIINYPRFPATPCRVYTIVLIIAYIIYIYIGNVHVSYVYNNM